MCCVCWVCRGGLRLLRVAWEDFVCGFWTGLGVLWCWLGAGFGVAGACVVIPCLRSYACWPCLGSVGGIATIGAALRRVAGVSGVYGRKTPAWLLGCAVASPCGGLGLLWCLVVWCLVVCLWCRCGLGRLCWWLGGNCYHRRCVAACRRRVGGLWLQNPPRGCSEGQASRARGGVYGRKTPGWLLKVQSTSVKSG